MRSLTKKKTIIDTHNILESARFYVSYFVHSRDIKRIRFFSKEYKARIAG